MARPSQPRTCSAPICRRPILSNEKAIAVSLLGQTVGMGPQHTAKTQRIYLCPQCALRYATGKMPSTRDPVELAFFKLILDLAGRWPVVTEAAFEQLAGRRQNVLYPETLTEVVEGKGEVLPPERRLKEAS
jgi:hypothetical protein